MQVPFWALERQNVKGKQKGKQDAPLLKHFALRIARSLRSPFRCFHFASHSSHGLAKICAECGFSRCHSCHVKESKSWCCHFWCLKYSFFAFKWHRWHRCLFHLSFDHASIIGFCFTQFTQHAWKQSLQHKSAHCIPHILRTCPSLPEMQVHWTIFNVDLLQRGILEYSNSSVWCPCSLSVDGKACLQYPRSRYLDSKLHIKCTSIFASIHSEKFYAYWVLPFCIQGSDTTAATEVFALTEESCISFVADLEINFKHLQTFWRFLIEWKRARFIRFDLKTRIAMPQFEHFLCDSVKSERWPWLLQSPLWLSSRGDTMISCRKHATNDDILLTVAQHSNQTAVLAFTDINMCNRRIYEQQVVWNGITWYRYCVMQADQASKIDGPSQNLTNPAAKGFKRELQNGTRQNSFKWFQLASTLFLQDPKASMRKPLWTLNTVKTQPKAEQPVSTPCPPVSLSDSKLFMAMLLPNRRLGQSFQAFEWHSIGRKLSCFWSG